MFIGADESKIRSIPFKNPNDKFIVLYFGSFIPLHGVKTIIESAKILSDHSEIVFQLCGDGQTKKENQDLANKFGLYNVDFLGQVNDETLLQKIKFSDVCLGLFGSSDKASYSITNKVCETLCSQKPLITMDSPAIREIEGANDKNCILIPKANPKKLADAILYLKNDVTKRKQIAIEGRKLYEKNLSIEKTGQELINYLTELTSN